MTKVRLLTLCGCSKITEADDDLGLPIAIKVPIGIGVGHMAPDKELRTSSVHVRTFRFEQVTDLPEYVEILDERLKL